VSRFSSPLFLLSFTFSSAELSVGLAWTVFILNYSWLHEELPRSPFLPGLRLSSFPAGRRAPRTFLAGTSQRFRRDRAARFLPGQFWSRLLLPFLFSRFKALMAYGATPPSAVNMLATCKFSFRRMVGFFLMAAEVLSFTPRFFTSPSSPPLSTFRRPSLTPPTHSHDLNLSPPF